MATATANTGSLESPLNMSSFIWNNRVTNENGSNPSASLATTLGGMSAAIRRDNSSEDNQFFSMSAALRADPFVPNNSRQMRSLSLSEPLGFHTNFGNGKIIANNHNDYGQKDGDSLGSYRAALPVMEEEPEEMFEQTRAARARSYSTSATFGPGSFFNSISNSTFANPEPQDPFSPTTSSSGSLGLLSQDQRPFLNRKFSVGSTWPSVSQSGPDPSRSAMQSNHRRSVTSNSYVSPIWESTSTNTYMPSIEPVQERIERQRIPRRYSLAPSSGFQPYDHFLESEHISAASPSGGGYNIKSPADNDYVHPQRRHSVAGPSGSYFKPSATPFDLASSLGSLHIEDPEPTSNWGLNEECGQEEYQYGTQTGSSDLGKGMTLSQLSHHGSLYVVEFKAGRSDLFYVADNNNLSLKRGDLVIVEADRGKDLGKVTNDSITPQQIQALQKEHAEAAALAAHQEGQRVHKEIHPKRIFRLAAPTEISQLVNKNQDEIKAMMVCQTKVRQKKLPMEVVDAEYQWDRRKLTFYFRAEHRIDFRELVRDLFKIYKTRIWMYAVSPSMTAAAASTQEMGVQTSSPRVVPSPAASPSPPQPRPTAVHHSLHHHASQPSLNQFHHYQHQQQQQQQQQQQLHQYAQQQQQQQLLGNHYHHQPQLQDIMRQVQAQYFSAPPQAAYQNFHHEYHQQDDEPPQHQYYEQPYQLQPPHPLM
ncbi:hypothetical protein BGZ80_006594 [Entomortierella chlamydospora]|uniref:PSP1 C-terminal domain-containing protein n=1 Tax=Entomortierella chlamydospora TaxID=101097 RepID=A0A9P6ST59_9FUNG|nr:hypothetical protein BGZ80_006594 [Entomortierella chlamydospora]